METARVIQAVTQQWRASTALRSIPLRSTRIPPNAGVIVPFPYAICEAAVQQHKFSSARYRLTWYEVTLTVYVGNDKGDLNTISDGITALFDRNIGLPVTDNCYVLTAQAIGENPSLDLEDYYGPDINVLTQTFRVLCNETIGAVRSALAT